MSDGGGVELREVDAENVRAVCELTMGAGQEVYVSPAAFTVAEAAFEPDGMLRAIYRPEGDRPLARDSLVILVQVLAE